MKSHTSNTLPLPAYGWQGSFACLETVTPFVVNVITKRHNLRLMQGCFPMTD